MRRALLALFLLVPLLAPSAWTAPQQPTRQAVYKVEVDLVQLSVAVTDRRGRYIRSLRPGDFRIYEDGIPQKLAMFSEGGAAPETLLGMEERDRRSRPVPAFQPSSNIFILFDTSNFMYRSFVYAQDAIGEFVRSLDNQDSIALYTFSRNLLRACPLTTERRQVLLALRQLVAGSDTSLYNTLLLTLQDAARVSGRKVVVVFSNGPDNGSMVSPEAVREFAENEGIPIYMISTQDANKDEVSATVFRRLSARTGGRAYFARNWQKQAAAFRSIGQELTHVYLLSYYPAPNANLGWRSISVELVDQPAKKHRIRTRSGYRPKLRTAERLAAPLPETSAGP